MEDTSRSGGSSLTTRTIVTLVVALLVFGLIVFLLFYVAQCTHEQRLNPVLAPLSATVAHLQGSLPSNLHTTDECLPLYTPPREPPPAYFPSTTHTPIHDPVNDLVFDEQH
ncbi:hypothetical protein A0H81_08465 [Grifola frondosa]|uniref:Uncharacterized protein n=1 Tax=Grifola frondosa TaxID=5627 RepID=A0A1C7M3Z1_GRIFR|nr:hypothetical protein A0H81_08465 [Grifola frondosa]